MRVSHLAIKGPRLEGVERVVRGLLSGRRATHYDAAIGGEIWHVGEEERHEI